MIDVIKRLAELDASNPNVAQPTLHQQPSLATVSNIEGDQLSECGPMGMSMGGGSRTPASFSINASGDNGDEVANMLTQIMNLAGVKPVGGMGDIDHDGDHDIGDHELELGSPGPVEIDPKNSRDSMSDIIGMVDRMNGDDGDAGDSEDEGVIGGALGAVAGGALGGPMGAMTGYAAGSKAGDDLSSDDESQSPVAKMAGEVQDMTAELKDEGIGAGFDSATTTPNETPANMTTGDKNNNKPKTGFTGAGNNNLANESVDQVSLQLLKAYEAFKNGQ